MASLRPCKSIQKSTIFSQQKKVVAHAAIWTSLYTIFYSKTVGLQLFKIKPVCKLLLVRSGPKGLKFARSDGRLLQEPEKKFVAHAAIYISLATVDYVLSYFPH